MRSRLKIAVYFLVSWSALAAYKEEPPPGEHPYAQDGDAYLVRRHAEMRFDKLEWAIGFAKDLRMKRNHAVMPADPTIERVDEKREKIQLPVEVR